MEFFLYLFPMQTLHLSPAFDTPEINFDPEKGELNISGRCIIENPAVFFKPLYDWLDDYIKQPRPETTLHVNLEYFNTSSSKYILDFLKKIKTVNDNGSKLIVKWEYHHGDEDTCDTGRDFSNILKVPFEFIEHP
jgi:hypothetical protein